MEGSSIWRALEEKGYKDHVGLASDQLDLRDQQAVFDINQNEQPEIVVDAAVIGGGILANNNNPFKLLMDNMKNQNNLIDGAHKFGVEKLIFLEVLVLTLS